jgi:hypothetical protein
MSMFGPRFSELPLAAVLLVALASSALAQQQPYIGYVYPAGGQAGSTFQIRVGGQSLEDVSGVIVTGSGVTARIAEFYRRLNGQEMQLINEQLRELRQQTMSNTVESSSMKMESSPMTSSSAGSMAANPVEMLAIADAAASPQSKKEAARKMIDRIERRTLEYVPNPAAPSIASLVLVEVTAAPDAEPGPREIRLVTLRGISNPLGFYVGQVPEHSRKPMISATLQVLGKESSSLRKRPLSEEEDRVSLPCTLNGQIASGEINRYRFEARKGQRLVISTLGRQLVPFIADAVPGWFQPVLTLYDAQGKEVAYDDDYRFKPDPTIFYEVPKDGEYVLVIRDSLYRGREDFVYRITAGEMPFITSIFPLGGAVGATTKPQVKGWNLEGAELVSLPSEAETGVYSVAAKGKGLFSNYVPFALDTLPEILEQEPNNTLANAQKVTLPVMINGRINKPDDWDVFQFSGRSNDTVIAEVMARRLDSPLDSVVKLTDSTGKVLAFNDDHEDLAAGLNTHAADSYLMARLPADGDYYLNIGDMAREGGEEYGYRLRLSAPQPDFELRVVPSNLSLRSKSTGTLTVYVQRKDGFAGPTKLSLKNPPPGFTNAPITLAATQSVARITIRTTLASAPEPVTLTVRGTAKVGEQEFSREAIPAEDRMQAFLWRQLVPAKDLRVLVFDPNYQPPPKRILPVRPVSLASTNTPFLTNAPASTNATASTNAPTAPTSTAAPTNTVSVVATNLLGRGTNALAGTNTVPGVTNTVAGTNSVAGTNAVAAAAKPKFTKQQVAGRLRMLNLLYQEAMFTDDFYLEKVAELDDAE